MMSEESKGSKARITSSLKISKLKGEVYEFKVVETSCGSQFYLVKFCCLKFSAVSVLNSELQAIYNKKLKDQTIFEYDLIYNGKVLVLTVMNETTNYREIQAFDIEKNSSLTIIKNKALDKDIVSLHRFRDNDLFVCYSSYFVIVTGSTTTLDFT